MFSDDNVCCMHYIQIWQKVKAANQNFTVCEIGATIGRLWREMNDMDKQQYNEDFAVDKVSSIHCVSKKMS